MKVVNLFGGPGCGKTGVGWSVAGELKRLGYKIEFVPEYVKDIVYDDTSDKTMNEGFSSGRLSDQQHIFSEQHRRLKRVSNKVDIVITDGPLFNSIVYSGKGEDNKHFHSLVMHEFNKYDNLNYLLKRSTIYKQEGRYQDEAGAIAVDEEVSRCFHYFKLKHKNIDLPVAIHQIIADLYPRLQMQECPRCGAAEMCSDC
ncbi:MAG: AAA family ATPase [Richelia sp. RM2_1_2]|nr:AAA family ATPase [Richelia sp. RM2_1_2]